MIKIADMHKYKFRDSAFDRSLWAGLEKVNAICAWMDEHGGKSPSSTGKTKEEKRLGMKVVTLRVCRKGGRKTGRRSVFYPEYNALVVERGYPDLFKIRDMKEKWLKKINELCDWMDEHGRKIPHKSGETKEEKWLSERVGTLRQSKRGRRGFFYPEYNALVVVRGYPDLFKVKDLKEEGLKHVNKICDWMDEHVGEYPSKRSKEKEEKTVGRLLSGLQQKRKGNGSGVFYLEYDKLVEQRGYPDLFKVKDLKEEGLKHVNKMCDWMDEHAGEVPSLIGKTEEEKRLGRRVHNLRQNRKGNGAGVFHPEYAELLVKRGYPDLFVANGRKHVQKRA